MASSKLVFVLLWLAGVCLAGSAVVAQHAQPTIDVADVQPGMRGYGLSVFRGTEPERFDVEVIDVLHGFLPGQDLILARTPHPLLNTAIAVGGMSGSPIYFNGRLAGAYAYGWPFGREPVIGITPIRSMLAEIDRPIRPSVFQPARVVDRPASQQARATGASYRGGEVDAFSAWNSHTRSDASAQGAVPVSTPLMLSGFGPVMRSALSEALAGSDLVPLQGGGAGQRTNDSQAGFVNGGAIGVQLIRGDMTATAVGTVTHIGNGSRLLGFGHPMMNAGQTALPTATARVVHIMQTLARSFKISEPLRSIGTLVHDRQSAIVVDREARAEVIPVRIRLRGVEGAPKTEWNIEVASQRFMAPMLVFSALGNAIEAVAADQTDVVFNATYDVDIEGQERVHLEDSGYMAVGPLDPRALSRLRLFELFEIAYGNPFEPSKINRIDIELAFEYERDVVEIVDATVAATEVDPDSDVDVRVRMRRFDGQDVYHVARVHVPASAAGETLSIEVAGGAAVRPDLPEPRNVREMLQNTARRYASTELVTSLAMTSLGLRFEGHIADALPLSALNALQRTTGRGAGRPLLNYRRRADDLGAVVVGSSRIEISVRTAVASRR